MSVPEENVEHVGRTPAVLLRAVRNRWLARLFQHDRPANDHLTRALSILAPYGELEVSARLPGTDALDTGYRVAHSYSVLPSVSGARLLLPADSRRAAARSFRVRYASHRSTPARIAYGLVTQGLLAGAGSILPFDRIEVLRRLDLPPDALPRELLADHLSEVLGTRVMLGASLGVRDPHQTVALHAVTPNGAPAGFVKVAWNDLTRQSVRGEAQALEHLAAGGRLRLVRPPRLCHHGQWGEFELLVTEPLPIPRERRSSRPEGPKIDAALEVASSGGLQRLPVVESTYWRRSLDRIRNLRCQADRRISTTLDSSVERLEALAGGKVVSFGSWHGDWVPWNYRERSGQLLTWDWEYFSDAVPVGFDLLHFFFGTAFFRDRRDGVDALRTAGRDGLPVLKSLGTDSGTARIVYGMYALEMLLRRLDILVNGGGKDDHRFFPAVYGFMDQLLTELYREDRQQIGRSRHHRAQPTP